MEKQRQFHDSGILYLCTRTMSVLNIGQTYISSSHGQLWETMDIVALVGQLDRLVCNVTFFRMAALRNYFSFTRYKFLRAGPTGSLLGNCSSSLLTFQQYYLSLFLQKENHDKSVK